MRKARTPIAGGNWLLPPTHRCGLGNLDLWQSLNAPLHARHFWDKEITVQSFVNKVFPCGSWAPASKRCNPNPTPPPARTWAAKSQPPRLTLLLCPALPLPENSLHRPCLKPTPGKTWNKTGDPLNLLDPTNLTEEEEVSLVTMQTLLCNHCIKGLYKRIS